MKLKFLLLAAVLAILLVDVHSNDKLKRKKYRRKSTTTTTESEAIADSEEVDTFSMMEQDDKFEEEKKEELKEEYKEDAESQIYDKYQDLCSKKHCGAGRVCDIKDNGEAECICIPDCPVEYDPRRRVCSNHNETWPSDCSVYQMRCWCERGLDKCKGEKFGHVHIEYYGECREMPTCTETEMADFPRRMRDWLFNIMRDMADRKELTPHYLEMEREAENNMTRRWTNAAIWKWCDLDGHPHDRSISRHELFPIRAPLMSLEHCIAPFLDSCDSDDDHRITLKEWGKCLELDEDDLEDRCDSLYTEEE